MYEQQYIKKFLWDTQRRRRREETVGDEKSRVIRYLIRIRERHHTHALGPPCFGFVMMASVHNLPPRESLACLEIRNTYVSCSFTRSRTMHHTFSKSTTTYICTHNQEPGCLLARLPVCVSTIGMYVYYYFTPGSDT